MLLRKDERLSLAFASECVWLQSPEGLLELLLMLLLPRRLSAELTVHSRASTDRSKGATWERNEQ